MSSAMTIAAVGTAYGAYSANKNAQDAKNSMPQPISAPPPSAMGSITNQYGGFYTDPTTGQVSQVGYDFDPTAMGRTNDADSMYNQFMGNDNSRLTGNLDAQIQQLTQQIERLQNQQNPNTQGVGKQKSLADVFGPSEAKLWTNPDGSPVGLDRQSLNNNKALYDEFLKATASHGHTYGNGGDDYFRWANDIIKQHGVQQKLDTFHQTQDVNVGNTDVRDQAIKAFQAKLGYLTGERARISGGGPDLSKNPLMKYLNDLGGGGMLDGNGQPSWMSDRTGSMDATARAAQARAAASMGRDGGTDAIDAYLQGMDKSNFSQGLDPGYAGSINVPKLDLSAPGLRARMMDARAEQELTAGRNLADQQAAHRGMLSSSTNEIGRTGDTLNLANAHTQNLLGATDAYNSALGQQYGMDLNAAQFGAGERGALFGRQLGKASLGASEAQQHFANLLGATNLKNQQNNWNVTNANWADQFANQNDQSALANQWQLYGARRGENQDAYSRNLGMYNLLNNQTQQARGNQTSDYQNSLAGAGMMGGWAQHGADNINAANTADTQMQNSFNMAGWNQQNSADAAQQQALMAGLGGLGKAGAAYYYYTKDHPAPPKPPK